MKKLLLTICITVSLFAGSISTKQASKYLGQTKTVCGKVVSTYYARSSSGAPTFLNLDRPYPNNIFTAVIFEENRSNFRGKPENIYKYKKICVTGVITEYKGVPQIVLESDSQIK
jgi:DNA/RNA endonuclease YhcR with UshA esterase domain